MTKIYLLPDSPPETRFPFGTLAITTAAADILPQTDVAEALRRHGDCDWGDLSRNAFVENWRALKNDSQLISGYHDRNGVKFWIITEADRSATTVLLPEDY
jgi:hypothetical protein